MNQVPVETATLAAPKINRLIFSQFQKGQDPYGRPWRGLLPSTIAKGRDNPPLTDTRALRDGTKALVRPGLPGIRLLAGAVYWKFHQTGFHVRDTFVPPRKIFPDHGLPAAWAKILKEAARQAFKNVRERT
jgi:hypothetical protein